MGMAGERPGGQPAPLTAKVAAPAGSSLHGLRCRCMFGPFSGLLWDAGGGGGGGGVRFQGPKGERWEEMSFLVFARRCLELGCTFLFCEERQG